MSAAETSTTPKAALKIGRFGSGQRIGEPGAMRYSLDPSELIPAMVTPEKTGLSGDQKTG
jgi:hypothetical protein